MQTKNHRFCQGTTKNAAFTFFFRLLYTRLYGRLWILTRSAVCTGRGLTMFNMSHRRLGITPDPEVIFNLILLYHGVTYDATICNLVPLSV